MADNVAQPFPRQSSAMTNHTECETSRKQERLVSAKAVRRKYQFDTLQAITPVVQWFEKYGGYAGVPRQQVLDHRGPLYSRGLKSFLPIC